MNAQHRPRKDRAAFAGVVAHRLHLVDRFAHYRLDLLGLQAFSRQTGEFEVRNSPLYHTQLRHATRRQGTDLAGQFGLRHLGAAGVARAQYENAFACRLAYAAVPASAFSIRRSGINQIRAIIA